MRKKFFMIVLMGFALLCVPTTANAQVAKVVTKGIQAISKATSKGGGKAASKAVSKAAAKTGTAAVANDARSASKAGTSKAATEAERTKTVRPVTYTCSDCNGSGKVLAWNNYYGCYQNITCSKCSGSGKIRRLVRY